MKQKHYQTIAPFRKKLREVYTVDVKYEQKVTGMYAHYNRIIILLKKDYREYDFQHELRHLIFLTQEIRIKYLYPLREYYEHRELFDFSNVLVNIVYDMYVDADLSRTKKAPKEYFEEKIRIYEEYLNNFDEYYDFSPELSSVVIKATKEYLNTLDYIVSNRVEEVEYLKDTAIVSQRKYIDSYLSKAGILDKFEWITYHDIYLRDQCIGDKI